MILRFNPDGIPPILKQHRIWAVMRLVPDPKGGKDRKVPFNARTGEPASSTDPSDWSSYDEARAAYGRGGYHGVSIFLDPKVIPITAFDLDHVIDSAGVIAPWAQEILDPLNTYTERSIGGEGIHALAL